MTTEVVPFEVGGVRVAEMAYTEWTDEQTRLVANTIARGANPDEFALFREVCQRMRLNPFAQAQIWFIKRRVRDETKPNGWGDAFSIQVGIDGLRLLAERTGLYQGRVGPEWARAPKDDGAPFVWRTAWLWDEAPAVARVGVWKRGAREATWAVATWRESAQWAKNRDGERYLMGLWATKPAFMLGKVAEAQALRAAFPAELAGVEYRPEIERQRGGMRVIDDDPRDLINELDRDAEIQPPPKPATAKHRRPAPMPQAMAVRAALQPIARKCAGCGETSVDKDGACHACGYIEGRDPPPPGAQAELDNMPAVEREPAHSAPGMH